MTRLTLFDSLAVRGSVAVASALAERRWTGLLRWPKKGIEVEFFADGRRAGAASTGPDGMAAAPLSRPGTILEARGGGACAAASIYFFEPGDPILVCDLDGTVSDASALRFWLAPLTSTRPFPGSAEALRSLSSRARIVYLTARRDLVLEKTRRWLAAFDFPTGPVLCRLWSFAPPSPEAFKTGVLGRLKRDFPGIVAGIGDRSHDARACLAHGIPAVLFRPRFSVQEARSFESWAEIRAHVESLLSSPR
jgi:hypothetical protein